MSARLELHVDKTRTLGLSALGVLMVGTSYFCTTLPKRTPQIAGWFGVVFFGACFTVIASQIFRTGPQFIVDERGLEDRRGKGFLIEWTDVTAISIGNMGRERFLCVEVTNPKKYLDRMTKVARSAARANKALGFSELTIAFSGLSHSAEEVAKFIREHYSDTEPATS